MGSLSRDDGRRGRGGVGGDDDYLNLLLRPPGGGSTEGVLRGGGVSSGVGGGTIAMACRFVGAVHPLLRVSDVRMDLLHRFVSICWRVRV